MRIHLRLLVALFALSGLVLSACGDDDDTGSGDTTTTTSEPTTTAPADGEEAGFDVYLSPAELGDDCTEVVAVPRSAADDGGVEDALTQLLAGPTEDEQAQDLSSWFSEETEGMLNGVVVEDGVAEVDFQDFSSIIPNASTSCGSAALLAQLDGTVAQFPDIDRAVYSFDGDAEAFYSWLQLDVPEA